MSYKKITDLIRSTNTMIRLVESLEQDKDTKKLLDLLEEWQRELVEEKVSLEKDAEELLTEV